MNKTQIQLSISEELNKCKELLEVLMYSSNELTDKEFKKCEKIHKSICKTIDMI